MQMAISYLLNLVVGDIMQKGNVKEVVVNTPMIVMVTKPLTYGVIHILRKATARTGRVGLKNTMKMGI